MDLKKTLRKGVLRLAFTLAAATTIVGVDMGAREIFQNKRGLNPEEIKLAETVFGNQIDYSKVRLSDGPLSFIQNYFAAAMVAKGGSTIYFSSNLPMEEVNGSIFLHEMSHVWQNQHNDKNSRMSEIIKLWLAPQPYSKNYEYKIDDTKKLSDYKIEQQAKIIEDYYNAAENIKDAMENVQSHSSPNLAFHKTPISFDVREQLDSALTEYQKLGKIISPLIKQENNDWHKKAVDFNTASKAYENNRQAKADDRQVIQRARAIIAAMGESETYETADKAGQEFKSSLVDNNDFLIIDTYSKDRHGVVTQGLAQIRIKDEDRQWKTVFESTDGKVTTYEEGIWEKDFVALHRQSLKMAQKQTMPGQRPGHRMFN